MKVERLVSDFIESNTFVLIKDGEALIVDGGASLEQVKKVVGGNTVLGVFLTHGHYDHAFNCQEYAKEYGCKIFANKHAKEALGDPAINYGETFCVGDFSNFCFFEGDGEIKLGNFDIQYFWAPGHSNCLNCYLIEEELFSGDCMFKDGIGRMDLITSNKPQMLESLHKLSKLKYRTCHSGHYQDSDFEKMKKNIQIYIKYLGRKN